MVIIWRSTFWKLARVGFQFRLHRPQLVDEEPQVPECSLPLTVPESCGCSWVPLQGRIVFRTADSARRSACALHSPSARLPGKCSDGGWPSCQGESQICLLIFFSSPVPFLILFWGFSSYWSLRNCWCCSFHLWGKICRVSFCWTSRQQYQQWKQLQGHWGCSPTSCQSQRARPMTLFQFHCHCISWPWTLSFCWTECTSRTTHRWR